MYKNEWTKRWKNWVRETDIPNVWERKDGGYLVRARVKDPVTAKLKEIKAVLPNATKAEAYAHLEERRDQVRAGGVPVEQPPKRFRSYAIEVYEKKASPGGRIRSAAGRMRWRSTLQHLIDGTSGEMAGKHVNGFGEMFVQSIQASHVDAWRDGIAALIATGDYAPTTCNGWLSVLKVIMKQARRDFGLRQLPTEGLERFDTSEHHTYTEEQPNSLPADRVGEFLVALRELYPQHYAMAYLGFVTGLRPSSLRPLRRRGPESDVRWDQGCIHVRQSQTIGPEVMKRTKQGTRYSIQLPVSVLDVLQWHVDTQLDTPEQQDSDLLFPSVTGGYRASTTLNKPFAAVAEEIGLGYPFTQRGMRRTYQDLTRAAQVSDLVTRSISGHSTERMQHHYSTVAPEEQRSSIAKVVDLFDRGDRDEPPTR